jgi:hypothetical protein
LGLGAGSYLSIHHRQLSLEGGRMMRLPLPPPSHLIPEGIGAGLHERKSDCVCGPERVDGGRALRHRSWFERRFGKAA